MVSKSLIRKRSFSRYIIIVLLCKNPIYFPEDGIKLTGWSIIILDLSFYVSVLISCFTVIYPGNLFKYIAIKRPNNAR